MKCVAAVTLSRGKAADFQGDSGRDERGDFGLETVEVRGGAGGAAGPSAALRMTGGLGEFVQIPSGA